MNVFITGAGLIGTHVAAEMIRHGHRPLLFDVAPDAGYVHSVAGEVPMVSGDIRDLPALIDAMREHQAELVFHSAAQIGMLAQVRPYNALDIAIGGTIAVAEAARLTGVRRIVFTSTLGVYDRERQGDTVDEDSPLGADIFYSASKISNELILRSYGKQYGMEIGVVRFAHVYGLGRYVGGSKGGEAVHNAVADAIAGGPVVIGSRLKDVQEYVYVKDVAQAVASAFEKPLRHTAYNIGTGVVDGPEDLATALASVNPAARIEFAPDGPDDQPPLREAPYDLARAKRDLAYEPRFDLPAGIADFAEEIKRTGQGLR